MKKNLIKNQEIDLLRGFAILAVVIIHTTSYNVNINGLNLIKVIIGSVDFFAHFAVPLFVFISGFVLFLRYQNNYSIKNFYKKRFFRIIPPYLFFSIFYLILSSVNLTNYTLNFPNLQETFVKIISANTFYHLWFIALIVQFSLIYPVIEKIIRKTGLALWFILIMFLFKNILINIPFFELLRSILDKTNIFSYLGYFLLGIYFVINKNIIFDRIKKLNYLYLVFFIVFTFSMQLYNYFDFLEINNHYSFSQTYITINKYISPFFNISRILFLYKICKTNLHPIIRKILLFLSKFSFGIYLIHAGIACMIGYPLSHFTHLHENTWMFYFITFTLTIVLSAIITYLISLLPKSKYIIG